MPNFTKDIAYGATSPDVTNLQNFLIKNGYATFTGATGYFGDKTKAAVAKFQMAHLIAPASGIFGPKTRAAVNATLTGASLYGAKLASMATSLLGVDVTPLDEVSDDVACATSVNAVFLKTFGKYIGGGASTEEMRAILVSDSRFQKIDVPEAGCIIISATGLGKNPAMPHGHVGIVLDINRVASNNSANGIWDVHYSVQTWRDRYEIIGKYPVEFFRVIKS